MSGKLWQQRDTHIPIYGEVRAREVRAREVRTLKDSEPK